MRKHIFPFFLAIPLFLQSSAQEINPDSTGIAFTQLQNARKSLLAAQKEKSTPDPLAISVMLELGMWPEALGYLKSGKIPAAENDLLWADYHILNNDFPKAEQLVNGVLKAHSQNEKAILLKAFLQIQAWRLPDAVKTCEAFLRTNPHSSKMQLMLGRALLLQKKYNAALKIAKSLENENPKDAAAYLLEADVYFWNQHPDQAEAPLQKSLQINPFNADARFSYGYAIWRRVDATQLDAMAAQWELALAINPLHFQTHWHWGNGHTNLTYADYAEKDDEEVRKALVKADDEVRKNNVRAGLDVTIAVEKQYPGSVLPLVHRGSIYYDSFDMDRRMRLDSAENLFRAVLARKTHYGPAHNGLSAVIKSKRIPYLAVYDSISNALKTTNITDLANFIKVFPEITYFPGDLAKAMVWNQMYTAVVYFPFLSKQENTFRIPPLHIDLAIAMKSPQFRYMTTFDNRQWMDIRGVGSGAAAIEYVERGAFLERNVILHEYVHLFHGRVLTDDENRKIRARYYKAMQEKRTLDYYSQNNESEYFAQTYPAYFEPVKVHPLDFKSMNTTSDLKTKDPEMYAFLDKLIKKERSYLRGDKQVMASNWSQVYLNLSNSSKIKDVKLAAAYLDTALSFDSKDLPALLAYAQLKIDQKDLAAANEWITKAQAINSRYAPVYTSFARLAAARFSANEINLQTAINRQAGFYEKALALEGDHLELASVSTELREMYRKNGLLAQSILVAEQYAKKGSVISTYLRDRRDDAVAYAAAMRSLLGYPEPLEVLKKLVGQKPQNYEYRNLYADALSANKRYKEAIATIQEAQRILAAAANARPDYSLRIAENYHALGEKDSVAAYLQPFLDGKVKLNNDLPRYSRLLIETGNKKKAEELIKKLPVTGDNAYRAELSYAVAKLAHSNNQESLAAQALEKAIGLNPYFLPAYQDLLRYYQSNSMTQQGAVLQKKLGNLEIKPGPAIQMEEALPF
ncbi:MAG TPA: tetratricopeptide repeat protein [Chitinophagaceae bacterium]|nr:tetratricopeptide repeat protein [Chitinophagaceae bacterium]